MPVSAHRYRFWFSSLFRAGLGTQVPVLGTEVLGFPTRREKSKFLGGPAAIPYREILAAIVSPNSIVLALMGYRTIIAWDVAKKANLPGTLGRHCLDLVPTFHAGCFLKSTVPAFSGFYEPNGAETASSGETVVRNARMDSTNSQLILRFSSALRANLH